MNQRAFLRAIKIAQRKNSEPGKVLKGRKISLRSARKMEEEVKTLRTVNWDKLSENKTNREYLKWKRYS